MGWLSKPLRVEIETMILHRVVITDSSLISTFVKIGKAVSGDVGVEIRLFHYFCHWLIHLL